MSAPKRVAAELIYKNPEAISNRLTLYHLWRLKRRTELDTPSLMAMRELYGKSESSTSTTNLANVSTKVVYNVTGCDSIFNPSSAAVSISVPSLAKEFKAYEFPFRSMNMRFALNSIRKTLSNNNDTLNTTETLQCTS